MRKKFAGITAFMAVIAVVAVATVSNTSMVLAASTGGLFGDTSFNHIDVVDEGGNTHTLSDGETLDVEETTRIDKVYVTVEVDKLYADSETEAQQTAVVSFSVSDPTGSPVISISDGDWDTVTATEQTDTWEVTFESSSPDLFTVDQAGTWDLYTTLCVEDIDDPTHC